MKRPLVIVVSDHPLVFDRIRSSFEPEFDVLTMVPHAESVIAAAGVLEPKAVIVDLSRRSVRSSAATARLIGEIPGARLVVLLDREANPDVKRRTWLESGLERDKLGPGLSDGLERAFGGRVLAVPVDTSLTEETLTDAIEEIAYSPTFSC